MLRNTLTRLNLLAGLEITGTGVGVITLNRPDARNALSRAMRQELEDSLRKCADSNANVRCVILQSVVPKVFCAGADLKERKTMSQEEARSFVDQLRMTFNLLEDLPMPTICAVEGAALGGGLELALAADIRIGGANATFGVPETTLAIIPGAGGTYRLPKLVGLSQAQLMAFTGRALPAAEAVSKGVINEATAEGKAFDVALSIANRIAENGPVAVRAAKQAMREGLGKSRGEALAVERSCYDLVIPTKDRLEGLKAFSEKRKPVYTGH